MAVSESEAFHRKQPFTMLEPQRLESGLVFSSPHSGRSYFPEFVRASVLSMNQLRASEDAFVDTLFTGCAEEGAPLLCAVAPRAFVDLNRHPDDLDPELIVDAGDHQASAHARTGLGVVPRIVAEGVEIYGRKLALAEAQDRVAHWHRPYHTRLRSLVMRAHRVFGRALLVDCHSMPSRAQGRGRRGADVVLGDQFGTTCDPRLLDAVQRALEAQRFRVARNAPFAGGHITQKYGRPERGVSAVQIEIDRGLYLNESQVTPSETFHDTQTRLLCAVRVICGLISSPGAAAVLAAE